MNKLIFFRDDDIRDCDANLKKFIGLFLLHKIPVHLAVIPGSLTARCRSFLRKCLKSYPQLIEIGQHGFRHLNYSPDNLKKYEFGPNRTYIQQRKDIIKGKEILKKIINEDLIFTPPWHGFDANTLKVLSDVGFKGISMDKKTKIMTSESIQSIPASVYIDKKDQNGWFVEKAAILLREIRAVKAARVGILVHHDHIKTDQEFQELSSLLSKLRNARCFQFCKLSAIGSLSH